MKLPRFSCSPRLLLFGLFIGLIGATLFRPAQAGGPTPPSAPVANNRSTLLEPVALSPVNYMHIPQHATHHPKVYCGPTVIAMGYSPYYVDWAFYHPAEYVDNFARHTKTSLTHGTTATEMLNAMTYLTSYHDMADKWEAVEYQGIHDVPRAYYTTYLNRATLPSLNTWLSEHLRKGSLVVGHLGWYVEDAEQKRFHRKGGHYVLLTGIYKAKTPNEIQYLEILDPLDHKDKPVEKASATSNKHYIMELRQLTDNKKRFLLTDASGQISERQAGDILFQPYPTPGKEAAVLPFLEGVMVLEATP
jgi:hypothetical protein